MRDCSTRERLTRAIERLCCCWCLRMRWIEHEMILFPLSDLAFVFLHHRSFHCRLADDHSYWYYLEQRLLSFQSNPISTTEICANIRATKKLLVCASLAEIVHMCTRQYNDKTSYTGQHTGTNKNPTSLYVDFA